MPATASILPPRYRDVRPLAVGGMGEIYSATDRELGRKVVLKVLAERYAQNEALRARFEREALAAARLSGTPNVVTIFDVTEHNGRPIIVMEHLAGGSLHDAIGGTAVTPALAISWLEEAAGALDAAHAAGIVHRDVKPANLLLDASGHVHVADFGVASAVGMASLTQTGTILGTAGYLSPEQARGEHATAASDRYALAVVAWELLVGRRPFAADSATAEALAHVNDPAPSAAEANPALPAQLDRVFGRALAKDPGARYPTRGRVRRRRPASVRGRSRRHGVGRADSASRRDSSSPRRAPRLVDRNPGRCSPRGGGRRGLARDPRLRPRDITAAHGRAHGHTALLDQAEAIEGHRVEIDRLRKRAEKRC